MLDFNHMADRIHELLEAQKLLVRDISHELRSPLARLRVVVELAREDTIRPLPWMDDIERQVDRVNGLIGEMLMLSLMESTRTASHEETFAIGELFDDLLADMNLEAQARSCSLVFESTKEETRIAGQQELLRRALENIIRNAIRYTPVGGVVEVKTGWKPASTGDSGYPGSTTHMTITIRDEGPGVPESSLTQIFRPFYRANMPQENSTDGFGLGLAIADRGSESPDRRPGNNHLPSYRFLGSGKLDALGVAAPLFEKDMPGPVAASSSVPYPGLNSVCYAL